MLTRIRCCLLLVRPFEFEGEGKGPLASDRSSGRALGLRTVTAGRRRAGHVRPSLILPLSASEPECHWPGGPAARHCQWEAPPLALPVAALTRSPSPHSARGASHGLAPRLASGQRRPRVSLPNSNCGAHWGGRPSNCWYYSRTTNKYGRARDAKRTGGERNDNSDHQNTQQWDPWVSLRVLQLVSALGENNQLCPTF